jgi:hypothetical protein
MQAEVLLSEPSAAEHITSRMVSMNINGTDQIPIDAMLATPVWPCNSGDTLTAKVKDMNSAGETESDPYTGTATLPVMPPTKPSVVGFLFSGS